MIKVPMTRTIPRCRKHARKKYVALVHVKETSVFVIQGLKAKCATSEFAAIQIVGGITIIRKGNVFTTSLVKCVKAIVNVSGVGLASSVKIK